MLRRYKPVLWVSSGSDIAEFNCCPGFASYTAISLESICVLGYQPDGKKLCILQCSLHDQQISDIGYLPYFMQNSQGHSLPGSECTHIEIFSNTKPILASQTSRTAKRWINASWERCSSSTFRWSIPWLETAGKIWQIGCAAMPSWHGSWACNPIPEQILSTVLIDW